MSSPDRHELRSGVPILRLFKACARPNCESALAEKLATSSVQVVRNEPGFLGLVCAGPANHSDRDFVFASMWRDADAIKARFGHDWLVSFLPLGYAEPDRRMFRGALSTYRTIYSSMRMVGHHSLVIRMLKMPNPLLQPTILKIPSNFGLRP